MIRSRSATRPSPRPLAILVAAALAAPVAAHPVLSDALEHAPITFERNEGQFGADALYVSRGQAGRVSVSRDAITFEPRSRQGSTALLRVRFAGASEPVIEAAEPRATVSHHYRGTTAAGRRENVPHFGRVSLKDLYRGVDLTVYGKEGALEYDFIVAARADPRQIRLDLSAADHAWIDGEGNLRMRVGDEQFTQHAPVAFQQVGGSRVPVAARFEILAGEQGAEAGFVIADYDRTRALVIDPVMAFSTYLGGAGDEQWTTPVRVDAQGNVYVGLANYTGAQYEATVVKFNPTTQQVVYSTTLAAEAMIHGLAIGASGGNEFVAITGSTGTNAFPHCFATTDCANHSGGRDAFVTALNVNGNVIFSRLLGGSGNDEGMAIAVDNSGFMHVTGAAESGFPIGGSVLQPIFVGTGFNRDAFVTKLSFAGGFVYSTFLGGSGDDIGRGIAVDNQGNTYVAGSTRSATFRNVNAYQAAPGGGFVTKIGASGGPVEYSTFLGGSGDNVRAIAVNPATGQATVVGDTGLPSFPQTGTQRNFAGIVDAFVTRFSTTGALEWSGMFGGSGYDIPYDVALAPNGDAFVVGYTQVGGFPTLNPVQGAGGDADAFLTRVRNGDIAFSTLIGGSNVELAYGVGVDSRGAAYVAGRTVSANYPTTPGAYKTSLTGLSDAFLAKVVFPTSAATDLNGDGLSDFLFQNIDGRIAAWTMNATSITGSANLIPAGAGWSVIKVADSNGDGQADIYFQHTDGRIYTYQMNGLTVVGGKELFGPGTGWTLSHTADLNGDGKADLLLRHADGRAHLWLMDGTTIIGSASLLPAGSGWNVVGTGDLNGDGKADIVFSTTMDAAMRTSWTARRSPPAWASSRPAAAGW